MTALFSFPRRPALLTGFSAFALAVLSPAALAQPAIEGRVDRLEQEMKAVQRKVFQGGAGAVLQPDIAPPQTTTPQPGSPATSPVADLTARVAAIESGLARLTGQVEQNDYRLKQLEQAFADYKAQMTPATAPPALPPAGASAAAPKAPAVKPGSPKPAETVGGDDARTNAVAAIERPSSGDAAQDAYTYGFRLWTAKFYPEAQAQLKETLDKYGNSGVASRTANLLGRAYLDDGKPVTAAKILYENYRLRPKGDRAAESLAWTAESLIQAKDNARACLAYDELNEVFGSSMTASIRAMMEKGRTRAKCGA